MNPERREKQQETCRLGNIVIEKTPDGRITKVNDTCLEDDDALLVLQRHQKPTGFTKEQLLASVPEGVQDVQTLDFTYDPEISPSGAQTEEKILHAVRSTLGTMDTIAATPRKRGSEHKTLLRDQFPEAQENPEVDTLLDDSGLGLLGESMYGAYSFQLEETDQFLKPGLRKTAQFGRGSSGEKRAPFSYMETWVTLGYAQPGNKWKIESPEELALRTQQLLRTVTGKKNYYITHEANCVVFHLLAERSQEEIKMMLQQIALPEETKSNIAVRLVQARNFLDVLKAVKQSLIEHPISGYHYKKVLPSVLNGVALRSGDKGYGAISLYVLKRGDKGEQKLVEAAYDQQIEEAEAQ